MAKTRRWHNKTVGHPSFSERSSIFPQVRTGGLFPDVLPFVLPFLPYNGSGSVVSLMCTTRDLRDLLTPSGDQHRGDRQQNTESFDPLLYPFQNLTSISPKGPISWVGCGETLLQSWRIVLDRPRFRLRNLRVLDVVQDQENRSMTGSYQAMNIACLSKIFCDELLDAAKQKNTLPLERLSVALSFHYLATFYARLTKERDDPDRSWCLSREHVAALVGEGSPLCEGVLRRFDALLGTPFGDALNARFHTIGDNFNVRWCTRAAPSTGLRPIFGTAADSSGSNQDLSGYVALAARILDLSAHEALGDVLAGVRSSIADGVFFRTRSLGPERAFLPQFYVVSPGAVGRGGREPAALQGGESLSGGATNGWETRRAKRRSRLGFSHGFLGR